MASLFEIVEEVDDPREKSVDGIASLNLSSLVSLACFEKALSRWGYQKRQKWKAGRIFAQLSAVVTICL
jgi:hypothetical protein